MARSPPDTWRKLARTLDSIHRNLHGVASINTFLVAFFTVLGLIGIQTLITRKSASEEEVLSTINSIDPGMRHFVALQYFGGMLNRTYLVLVTDEMLCGAKVRGLLAAPINVTERWKDPYFYPKLRFLEKLMGLDPRSPEFLNLDRANFQIERDRISHVEFSVEKKWGMGTVPYAGRILLTILGDDTKELILLGTQDGEAIKNLLAGRAHDAV